MQPASLLGTWLCPKLCQVRGFFLASLHRRELCALAQPS